MKEIDEFSIYLLEKNLVIGTNSPIIRDLGNNQKSITWSNSPKRGLINKNFASIQEYIRIIQDRQFNFVLNDGGTFQFGYLFENGILIRQRLCFFPCPILITNDDIEIIQLGENFTDLLLLYLEDELSKINSNTENEDYLNTSIRLFNRTPLCFEYDHQNNTPNHPASHLHLNKRSCRIPIFGPISNGHFIRIIFRSFYPEIWGAHQKIQQWPISIFHKSILKQHKNELFFESIP